MTALRRDNSDQDRIMALIPKATMHVNAMIEMESKLYKPPSGARYQPVLQSAGDEVIAPSRTGVMLSHASSCLLKPHSHLTMHSGMRDCCRRKR